MNILLLADKHRFSTELVESCLIGSGNSVTICGSEPDDNLFSEYNLGISWYYPHILREQHINAFEIGVINCHPSFLPYNRGAYPNVWPLIDDTPAGVSIHWINEGVDEGNLLSRARVETYPNDDGFTLYNRLETEMVRLFLQFWPSFQKGINNGIIREGRNQDEFDESTHHYKKELDEIRNLENSFSSGELKTVMKAINIIRSCTFPGYDGAYFLDGDGNKIYIEVNLYR